jgi:hypothetical protein
MSEELIQPETVIDQVNQPIDEGEANQSTPDLIFVTYVGQCSSLSERSSLSFHIGRHSQNESLHLRICGNTGNGMYCKDWCAIEQIETVVLATPDLTAHSLHVLHPGKSINTGGFILAVLRSLGYVRAQADNTRLHEHTPEVSLEQAIEAAMQVPEPEPGHTSKQSVNKPTRRKPKEISPV